MTLKELMNDLEMEELSPLKYFEQLATLLEYDESIPFDIFYSILSNTSSEELGEWLDLYFDELTDNIPDSDQDLFALLENIRQRLTLLLQSTESTDARLRLMEELHRFKHWYTKPEAARADQMPCSVLDAVTLYRAQRLGEPEHKYHFENCLDYPLDELSLHLGTFKPIELDGEPESDTQA